MVMVVVWFNVAQSHSKHYRSFGDGLHSQSLGCYYQCLHIRWHKQQSQSSKGKSRSSSNKHWYYL